MSDLPPSSTDSTPPSGAPVNMPHMNVPPSHVPQQSGVLTHPQIIAAIITSIISLIVAFVGIIPALVDDDPAPTPTPVAAVVLTFTPSDAPRISPTDTSVPPTLTPAPSDTASVGVPSIVPVNQTTPLPVIGATTDSAVPASTLDSANEPNIRMFFDSASFTIRNQGGGKKSLAGVVFVSGEGRWEASQWGSMHTGLTNRDCLRLRDASTSPRNPPEECDDLLGLMEVGPAAIFWRDTAGFRVEANGTLLGTCTLAPCDLYFPPN